MQLSTVLSSLLLASAAWAVPVDNSFIDSTSIQNGSSVTAQDGFSMLEARAQITGVTCEGVDKDDTMTWSKEKIKSAYNFAKKHIDSQTGEKKPDAPPGLKEFGLHGRMLDSLPEECLNAGLGSKIYEMRLHGDEKDRLVWMWHSYSRTQRYCMVMTHRGLGSNDFKACT